MADEERVDVRAVAKYIRMSPQKVRLVVDVIRGMPVDEALDVLAFLPKAAALPVAKAVESAVANAEDQFGLSPEDLYIAEIRADDGPRLKRGRIGARARFKPILKRMSHITVVVAEREW